MLSVSVSCLVFMLVIVFWLFLLWKKKLKIITEINLVIRNYESTAESDFHKYLYSKKTQRKKYEWYKHDLMTYIDNLKYDNFLRDMDSHFSKVKVVNFDIIHNQCQGKKLENPEQYYQTIYDKDDDPYWS